MTSHFGCNFLLYTFAQPHPEPRLGPQAQASQNCEPGPRPCQAVTKARLGPAYVGLGPAGLGLQAGPCTSLHSRALNQRSSLLGISAELLLTRISNRLPIISEGAYLTSSCAPIADSPRVDTRERSTTQHSSFIGIGAELPFA
jgi:hypothetical protein